MVLLYNLGGIYILYPVKFPHPVNLQELLDNLALVLPCPVKLPFTEKFIQDGSLYIHLKGITVICRKLGIHYFQCIKTLFLM